MVMKAARRHATGLMMCSTAVDARLQTRRSAPQPQPHVDQEPTTVSE